MTIANVDGIVKFAIFFDVYFVRRIILLENDFFFIGRVVRRVSFASIIHITPGPDKTGKRQRRLTVFYYNL